MSGSWPGRAGAVRLPLPAGVDHGGPRTPEVTLLSRPGAAPAGAVLGRPPVGAGWGEVSGALP
ncbi:hypothetical protein ACF1BE_07420 [Streptomyces sp. NPDC014991]|uniref:hypothetical protein n=1 Tax=Streptomyces sp. NPDC014991 TaxID=3364935 RepID=UPI0036F73920